MPAAPAGQQHPSHTPTRQNGGRPAPRPRPRPLRVTVGRGARAPLGAPPRPGIAACSARGGASAALIGFRPRHSRPARSLIGGARGAGRGGRRAGKRHGGRGPVRAGSAAPAPPATERRTEVRGPRRAARPTPGIRAGAALAAAPGGERGAVPPRWVPSSE